VDPLIGGMNAYLWGIRVRPATAEWNDVVELVPCSAAWPGELAAANAILHHGRMAVRRETLTASACSAVWASLHVSQRCSARLQRAGFGFVLMPFADGRAEDGALAPSARPLSAVGAS
jgi:hypothetical protein